MSETPGPSPEEIHPQPDGFKRPGEDSHLNPLVARVRRVVSESKPQNDLGYESTVGIYGGRLVTDNTGKTVYDTTGAVSKIDRYFDPRLREIDDHVSNKKKLSVLLHGNAKKLSVLRRNSKRFFRHYFTPHHALPFVAPETKRYRGKKEETLAHVRQLGLEDYYGQHPNGIEIKKPEIYSNGVNLQDIWRADQIHSPFLDKIDRFQALKQASKYVRQIHDNHGGIGELLSSDVIFQEHTPDGTIANPVLNLPDIVYSPRKNFGKQEQRATDMLDFMVGMSMEEFRRTNDWGMVKKAVDTIIEGYGQEKPEDSVIKWTGILAKRGRLTMEEHSKLSIHNFPRLGLTKGASEQLRQTIINSCLASNQPEAQAS